MFTTTTTIVGLGLLVLAIGLVRSHRRAWHVLVSQDEAANPPDTAERDFGFRQYRRRMQASGMVGVVGVALVAGPLLNHDPVWASTLWAGVTLLLLWVVLLALVDAYSTRRHFARLRNKYIAEQARWQAEVRRLSANQSPGERPSAPRPASEE